MEFRSKKVLVFLIALFSISVINAQKPVSSPTPPIQEIEEDGIYDPFPATVSLSASVSDSKGKYVNGLTYKDFKVYDKGQLQEISFFLQDVPVSVGFLFELSFDMNKTKDGSRLFFDGKEIEAFIKKSHPRNDYFLIGFDKDKFSDKKNESTVITLESTQDLNKINSFLDEIAKIKVKADSNAFDVILFSFEKSVKSKNTKKVVILITDGGFDGCNTRAMPDGSWRKIIEQNDTTIYAINIRNLLNLREGRSDLSDFLYSEAVSLTGGKMFFPTSVKELTETFETIADELRSQYTLGYYPFYLPDSKWHKTKVEVILPKEKKKQVGKISVRTREGYSSF